MSDTSYEIRGEVDYASQLRKIGGEYEHIGEVLREVGVSNTYDAKAKNVHLYPLYTQEASCLIVVDDGIGMDTQARTKEQHRNCNGYAKSSLASYFHIGHSTKQRGKEIGQFSMGANLGLVQADVLGAVVTRTSGTPHGMYWTVIQPRMHNAFSDPQFTLNSKLMSAKEALECILDHLMHKSGNMMTAWAGWIEHAFEQLDETHGTMQLFVSQDADLHKKRLLDVEQRGWREPKTSAGRCSMISSAIHATQFYTYLRFCTRHGSLLEMPSGKCHMRQRDPFANIYADDTRKVRMCIWCNVCPRGEVVPYGFPIIQYREDTPAISEDGVRPGSRIQSMTTFWCRLGPSEFTRTVATGKEPVAVFVVMDSYNKKMEEYEGLGRSGQSRSGLGMCKMQGIVLSVHGTYVTTLRGDAADRLINALPTDDDPESCMQARTRDALKAWNEKFKMQNLMIVVDSVFDIKTDRNNITPAEMQRLLTEKEFLTGLANALEDFRRGPNAHSKNFDDMLEFMDTTKKGEIEKDVLAYCQSRARETLECGSIRIIAKAGLNRQIATILDVISETYARPGPGHESTLVHLFGLYGATVRSIKRLLQQQPSLVEAHVRTKFDKLERLWRRFGLLFNGQGVDAQIFEWDVRNDEKRLGDDIEGAVHHMSQYEFKVCLDTQFNHPFVMCDQIVVEEVRESLVNVTDSQGNSAEVFEALPGDALYEVGFYLDNIRNGVRQVKHRVNRSENLKIGVIIFPDLVKATFEPFAEVRLTKPRKIFKTAKASRSKRKRVPK